jgi:hypothetical protein
MMYIYTYFFMTYNFFQDIFIVKSQGRIVLMQVKYSVTVGSGGLYKMLFNVVTIYIGLYFNISSTNTDSEHSRDIHYFRKVDVILNEYFNFIVWLELDKICFQAKQRLS